MLERLRIIQVINVRWFNATAWYGLNLSRLLLEAGHDVLVLGLAGTDSFAKAREMGLPVQHLNINTLNPVRLPALMRKMTGIIRGFTPHIVNCHRGEGMVLWGLCKAAARRPFVLVRTRGDQRPPKANPANRGLHSRLVDGLIATNSRTARQCADLLDLKPDTLFTIPGGVNVARFAPDAQGRSRVRRDLGFGPDDLVVGLLGRFDPVKGQKELIQAVAEAREAAKQGGRLRLMLVGFPASFSRETVQGWIEAAGLAQVAVITGKVADVSAYLNAMDLGVVASQGSEAIARAAFEIMACGVPLVGTDVGVMPDLLSPDGLVPAGDPKALTELLTRSLTEPEFLPLLRERQQARISGFSDAAFLEQTLGVYRSLLDRKTPAS